MSSDPATTGEKAAWRGPLPKFMELHRAGAGWRCRGCGDFIAVGGRAIGVTGLYGPRAQYGHGSQTLFHPSCVRPWTADNGHLIPLAGQDAPSRAAYLRAWRARRAVALSGSSAHATSGDAGAHDATRDEAGPA